MLVNLALVFLSARIGCGNAQEWAEGYPKLQFGSLGLSAPLPFPAPAGSGIPTGESPMDVLIRFKAKDATSAASFTRGMVSIQLQLSGFMGGDNSWSKTSPGLSAAFIDSAGVLSSASIRLNVTGDAVAWTATTSTLTVNMEKLIATEIIDSEIAIVLAASSFIGGKGPIAPRCVARDTPLYVKKFLSAKTEVAELHTGFVSVAPIGCFGDVKVPFGVTASSWEMKKIGQSSTRNGVGMEETISVTLASRLDIFSVTTSVKSELVISGLLGTQTSDSNVLPIDVQQVTDHFSALDLFQSPPSTGLANTLNTGNWKQETGTLTLTIKDGRMLPLGVPFVFSFKLKLPAVSSESPQVSITAKTGTTVVIPSQLMDSASGDYAPLTTRARTFTVAKIGQLVSGGGQENTISVTLMSNFDIQSTTSYVSKITIAGLKGSASPDSSPQYPYPVVSASKDSVVGIFSDGSSTNMVSWIKSKGELILYIVNGRVLQAGTEYVFSVKLLNEVTPQSSPNMYIQASGETDTGRVEMQRGEGNEAPMFISEPTMSIAKVCLIRQVYLSCLSGCAVLLCRLYNCSLCQMQCTDVCPNCAFSADCAKHK